MRKLGLSELVLPQFGWAKREQIKDGFVEEIIAIHFLRAKEKLIDLFLKEKENKRYKKIRNPNKLNEVKKQVEEKYKRGKYNLEIPEFVRSFLHEYSGNEVGDKRAQTIKIELERIKNKALVQRY